MFERPFAQQRRGLTRGDIFFDERSEDALDVARGGGSVEAAGAEKSIGRITVGGGEFGAEVARCAASVRAGGGPAAGSKG